MKRSKIKYQLLGLANAMRRDRSPVVSPFGEGLLMKQHIRTLPSHKPQNCTSSIQVVIMRFMVQLFDQSRVTITGRPAPMSQSSETRLAARVSIASRYRRAPVSRTVKYPSSRKRRPPRCPTSSRDGVFRPR